MSIDLKKIKHPFQPDWVRTENDVRMFIELLDKNKPDDVDVKDWYPPIIYGIRINDEDVENYVKVASMEDIAENDYNLNIPLYVEKIIEDNLPSVEEAMADLKEAWNAAQKSESVFKQKLKEFII
ncbi:MAG: N-6 DNA methylase [Candidatus Marinimicrobia bacterium]|jgi:type I restriction-modification system DNA methylase subunit|nr:N-6 DNA methylase [Candidatus Neomarinimicrobiota bacterium]